MIVIAGTLTLGVAVDESVLDACRTMMEATHAENGCIDYVFSADPLNDHTLRVFEQWESLEDLEAHFEAPHMSPFRDAMAQWNITGKSIHRFTVTDTVEM
ncbi:MAG: putative quinol monooxygenase [Actinomycetota bacterium]|nr:putative quinol monooxygenase [Actinomycetota bacterium]